MWEKSYRSFPWLEKKVTDPCNDLRKKLRILSMKNYGSFPWLEEKKFTGFHDLRKMLWNLSMIWEKSYIILQWLERKNLPIFSMTWEKSDGTFPWAYFGHMVLTAMSEQTSRHWVMWSISCRHLHFPSIFLVPIVVWPDLGAKGNLFFLFCPTWNEPVTTWSAVKPASHFVTAAASFCRANPLCVLSHCLYSQSITAVTSFLCHVCDFSGRNLNFWT